MYYFILGLFLMAGLLLASRWFASANPALLIKLFKLTLFVVIGAAAIFFIFTGKFAWAFFALPALVPWFMRARTVHRAYRNFSSGSSEDNTAGIGNKYEKSMPGAPINKAQALEILGLNEGATEQQIRDAHRRLITGLHPDHGGSNYLSVQINQAKDVLIGK